MLLTSTSSGTPFCFSRYVEHLGFGARGGARFDLGPRPCELQLLELVQLLRVVLVQLAQRRRVCDPSGAQGKGGVRVERKAAARTGSSWFDSGSAKVNPACRRLSSTCCWCYRCCTKVKAACCSKTSI